MRGLKSRRGSVLIRFLFACVILIVLAGWAGIDLVRNIHFPTERRNGGDDVAIETPAGSFRVRAHEKLDPSALGISVYPGARRTDSSGGAQFEWVSNDGEEKGLSVSGASFITPDPPSKVIEFYRNELSNLMVIKERGKRIRLESTENGLKRIIGIHEESDGTHIGVAAIGSAASN